MGINRPGRGNTSRGRSAPRTSALLLVAAVVLFGATWAKASRYDLRAVPSPHFSKSVKIARVLCLHWLGDETDALAAANSELPEPGWSGIAPLPSPETAAGATSLPFPRFRAPPTAA